MRQSQQQLMRMSALCDEQAFADAWLNAIEQI
jgi:hypothetical protein